jgi:hypothetical protein
VFRPSKIILRTLRLRLCAKKCEKARPETGKRLESAPVTSTTSVHGQQRVAARSSLYSLKSANLECLPLESVTSHHESVTSQSRVSPSVASSVARPDILLCATMAAQPRCGHTKVTYPDKIRRRETAAPRHLGKPGFVSLSSNNGSASEHGAVLVTSPLSHLHLRSSRVADFLSVLRYTSVTLESLSHR